MVTAGAFSRMVRAVSRRPAPALVVALSVLSGVTAAGQSLPPIPKLPLEALEPPARAAIEQTLKTVEETPRDAERNGRLGMLLYANEQYESAEACFERAQALAPAEARWPYYLGKAQSNLSDARVGPSTRCEASSA